MQLAEDNSNNAHRTFSTPTNNSGSAASNRSWLAAACLLLLTTVPAGASGNDFALPSITDPNDLVRLADYQGKAVYLDFWSSWCAPCRESLPLLQTLEEELSGQPFAVVTVTLDAHPSDARKLVDEFSLRYPVASDISGRVAKSFGLVTLPTAYLISRDGTRRTELPLLTSDSYSDILALASAAASAKPPQQLAELR